MKHKRHNIPKRYTVKVLDFGTYIELKSGETIKDNKTLGGEWHETANEKLEQETNIIQGEIGTLFGIRFTVNGPTKNEEIELINRIELPKSIQVNKHKSIYTTEFKYSAVTGWKTISFFSFDSEEELIPGDYNFIVLLEGIELFRKRFKVQFCRNQ